MNLIRRVLAIRLLTLAHDLIAAGCAISVGLALRLGPNALAGHAVDILAFMAISGAIGYAVGLNSGIWKYASLSDLIAIVKTASLSIAVFSALLFLFGRIENFSRTVLVLSWVFTILFLSASRVMYRMWRNSRALAAAAHDRSRSALMIGATDSAEIFIKAASEGRISPYSIAGIVGENSRRAGRSIRGVRILGAVDNLEHILRSLAKDGISVECFILATEGLPAGDKVFERVADIANRLNIEILRLPDFGRLIDEAAPIERMLPQPIVLNDLLPRRPIQLDNALLGADFADATVTVTGGGGSIGSELCRQLLALNPKRLVILDSSEFLLHEIETELLRIRTATEIIARIANVRNRNQIMRLFEEQRPDVVFHAAALKHVPIVEQQPLEGMSTNVIGTANVADAALAVKARAMVLVSTDKAVNPSNVMGATKRMAESYCQALDVLGSTHFVTVRFGNVLGSAGSVVPLFSKQIAAGGPVTITHPEIERYFMTIPEAVQLVLHATGHSISTNQKDRGRIFVLDMGQPVKILDVARKMIRLAGYTPDKDIKIEFIGLRPGEKMFEELFATKEPVIATNVPGVLSAAPRTMFDSKMLAQMIEDMRANIVDDNLPAALLTLKRIVPEFLPEKRLSDLMGPEFPTNVVPLASKP